MALSPLLSCSDSTRILVASTTVKNSFGNRSRMSPSVQHVLLLAEGEIQSLHGSYATLPCSVSPHPQKSASRAFSRSVCKVNRKYMLKPAPSYQAFHFSAVCTRKVEISSDIILEGEGRGWGWGTRLCMC